MATIIKQEVFGRELELFATRMKWDRRQALGCLTYLWNGSQARKAVRATASQIAAWALAADEAEGARIVEALSDELVGFLKLERDGRYLIVGNAREISKLKVLKKSGKTGGKKTREKWRRTKGESDQAQDAEPNALADGVGSPGANARPHSTPLHSIPSHSTPLLPTPPVRPHQRKTGAGPGELREEDLSDEVAAANLELIKQRLASGLPAAGFGTFGDKS